jgi:hypothetical protein
MNEEKVTEWEIVDMEEQVNNLVTLDETKLSEQEKFVRSVLQDYEYVYTNMNWEEIRIKADPVSILKQIFDDANSAISQNAKWDIIPDHKTRANLKIKLLEACWVIKPKAVEVKVNFLSLLFGKSS